MTMTLLALLAAGAVAAPPVQNTVVDLTPTDGPTQRALVSVPNGARGMIVMLPGGSGDIGIGRDGSIAHGDNFTVRTRTLWAAKGYGVVIPDAIGDTSQRGLRRSPAYAAMVARMVTLAHRQAPGPVFLLGTSQGSIAAMNGAAHAAPGSIAGVVLTESVSVLGGSHETVFDADPAAVTVPALVVANRDDRCTVAPPADAPRIVVAMTHSPDVKVLTVSGGVTRSDKDCGSLTPHGYYEIEDKVVDAIAKWMDAHSR